MDAGSIEQSARAERILDAAGELLLWIGYRRLTVEDIARRADVGKGTVYLHWKSKQELLAALMLREDAGVMRDVVAGMSRAEVEVQLHRVMRALFMAVMTRPLAKALYTRDIETLGKLVAKNVAGMRARQEISMVCYDAYLDLLAEHGLLNTDIDAKIRDYAIHAATSGFYIGDQFAGEELQLPLEVKADLLAQVVRRAFEPPGDPDPRALSAVAPRAIELFDQMRAQCEPEAWKPPRT